VARAYLARFAPMPMWKPRSGCDARRSGVEAGGEPKRPAGTGPRHRDYARGKCSLANDRPAGMLVAGNQADQRAPATAARHEGLRLRYGVGIDRQAGIRAGGRASTMEQAKAQALKEPRRISQRSRSGKLRGAWRPSGHQNGAAALRVAAVPRYGSIGTAARHRLPSARMHLAAVPVFDGGRRGARARNRRRSYRSEKVRTVT